MNDGETIAALVDVVAKRPRERPLYCPACGGREMAKLWPIICRCGAIYESLGQLTTEQPK